MKSNRITKRNRHRKLYKSVEYLIRAWDRENKAVRSSIDHKEAQKHKELRLEIETAIQKHGFTLGIR